MSPVSHTASHKPVSAVVRSTKHFSYSKHVNSKVSVYCKNARLHTDDRLAELLGELNHCPWDVVLFSETRRNLSELRPLQNHGWGQLHSSSQQTVAAGVAILVKQRWDHGVT